MKRKFSCFKHKSDNFLKYRCMDDSLNTKEVIII